MKPIYTIMFYISMVLSVAAIIVVSVYGLKLGADFNGGSVLEVSLGGPTVDLEQIRAVAEGVEGVDGVTVNRLGEGGAIIRSNVITEETHQRLSASLKQSFPSITESRFDSIGPAIGGELKRKSIK